MDYKSNSSCSSPSKDLKNSDRCGLPYGTPVPVLPVRNNLRRPNSSHFPPASRFHFQKGLASKCSWKCTAIFFVVLSVVLTAALSYISGKLTKIPHVDIFYTSFSPASSLLNWSYQTSKTCTVLVGENSEIPSSKATTSETNLSTSSKPRPSSAAGSGSGGNSINNVYLRKRREVDSLPHVLLSDLSNSSASFGQHDSNNISTHASSDPFTTFAPLHEINSSTREVLLETVQDLTGVTEILNINATDETEFSTNDLQSTESSVDGSSSIETSSVADIDSTADSSTEKVSEDDIAPPENLMQKPSGNGGNKPQGSKKNISESHSMKPSDLEGPEVLQNDYPIYSYGQEEIEIVKLHQEPLSTTMKSKSVYNTSSVVDEAKPLDSSAELTENNLSSDGSQNLKSSNVVSQILKAHDFVNNTNMTNESNTPEDDHIKVVNVPQTPSKRLLVNVTITADPDSNNPQPYYVLSLSIPTSESLDQAPVVNISPTAQAEPANLIMKQPEKETAPSITNNIPDNNSTKEEPSEHWGGQCQCSCPDNTNDFAENGTSAENVSSVSNNDESSEHTSISSTSNNTESTTEISELWSTQTACSEFSTKLPPPPTILILEGRIVSFSKSLATNEARQTNQQRNAF